MAEVQARSGRACISRINADRTADERLFRQAHGNRRARALRRRKRTQGPARLCRCTGVIAAAFALLSGFADPISEAQAAAGRSEEFYAELAAVGDIVAQHDRIVALDAQGDALLSKGDRAGALKAYEEGLEIARRLAADDPDNGDLARDVSVSLERIGDIRFAGGDRAGALKAYEESLEIARRMAADDPGDARFTRDLSVGLDRIGNVRAAGGDRTDALKAYKESLEIRRRLLAADPGNDGLARDVSVSLNKIGDLRFAGGDRTGALKAYEEGLEIRRRLAADDRPGTPGSALDVFGGDVSARDVPERDVLVSLSKVGDVRLAGGDRAGALKAYEESLEIARWLAAGDPGHAGLARDVSVALDRIGDVRAAGGDQAAALKAYEESLAVRRRLSADDPGNARWARDLSVSLDRVGDVRSAAGDRAGARAAYTQSLEIRKRLATDDPGNADLARDRIVSNVKLAQLATTASMALPYYAAALAIAEDLARSGRLAPADAWMIDDLRARLATAEQAR